MRKKCLSIGVGMVIGVLLSSAVFVLAGSLDSFGAPGATSSYTLDDIYNRLDSGAAGTQSTFTEPDAGSGTGTMHTLNDIVAEAPARDDTDGATAADVRAGKKFWGLTGGQWGLQTGSLATQEIDNTTVNQLAGYYAAFDLSAVDTDLASGNVRSGVSIYGVAGNSNVVDTSSGDAAAGDILQGKKAWVGGSEVTGNVAAGSNVSGADGARTFDIPDGLYSGKTATANDLDLVADNIRQGANIFGVAGSALAATGDATAADVLIGKTFSNASAAGIVGTMPNNEAVTIVPTTTNQTIALGYHDGSGKVEGDADLVASNIKGGVTIFGQTGTFQCVAKTGQSVSYAAGDDGYYQKGCLPAVLPGWDYDRSHFKCLGGLTDNGDGTVTDNTTGLMWMKDARCYPTGMNWWQALAEISFRNEYGWSCEGLSADFDDWRLPNINELRSLFDPDLPPPYLPAGHPFIRVKYGMGDRYWSSTSSSDFAVFIVFLYPSYGTAIELKEQTFYVWPVRGGQ